MKKEYILITGGAGFIGFHLIKKLITNKLNVVAVDNLNSYYDVDLKKARLDELNKLKGSFDFLCGDIEDNHFLKKIFKDYTPNIVINLAAQAGVRYSIENPSIFLKSNIIGFGNLLELCKDYKISHLIYASSSSVYGGNTSLPFKEIDGVDHPVSIYAVTKKANELMAHTYSHLYNIPCTGLRFFTVYGPWGRPDMALFLFTKAILTGEPIKIFNNGNMIRDFTYIDDIVESIFRLLKKPPQKNPDYNYKEQDCNNSWAPYKIFNIGNSQPIQLMDYIHELEISLDIKAEKQYLPMQDGDVQITSADTKLLENWINFKPKTTVKEGINKFVKWYKKYYGIN